MLPEWIAYVQALGPTIATITIAAFSLWIALRQVWIGREQTDIARERIKHDLYDRRYAIYLAFEKLLRAAMGQKGLEDEKEIVLIANVAAHQAAFILSEDLQTFLLQLTDIAFRRNQRTEMSKNFHDLPIEERKRRIEEDQRDNSTILHAHPVLVEKFLPFLRLRDFQ